MSGGGSRVVVIGGGVVGVACAHYLREAGCAVAVIEKNTIGSACSHANCGYVCPSHVLPLAGPGVIWKTLGTFLKKDSPLAVRFRLDPALWSWFFRFARRCNHHSMMEAGKGISAILNSSRKLFGELFESRQVEAGWQEQGMLFVFRTPAEFEHYSHVNDLLRDSFDMPARRVESGELTAMDPALKPGLAGAWYYPKDAHLRPDQLMTSWSKLLRNKGVDIRENTEFVGFDRREGRIQSVQTSQGNIQADQVVVATGAWTPLQAREIGLRLPIQPGKGYSITMARPGLCPRYPMIFEEDRVAITPLADRYRIGSTMEFGGYDDRMNPRRLELLRKGARLYLKEPEADPVIEQWWGWRPMVPDGLPIIGRVAGRDNLFLATGHSMLGVSMATGTGKLVAEMITGQTPHLDPAPYSPSRF